MMSIVKAPASKAPSRLSTLVPASRPLRRAVIRRFKDDVAEPATTGERATVSFKMPHRVEFGQEIFVIGAASDLGAWDVAACVPLSWSEGDVWVGEALLPVGQPVEYKYIIKAADHVQWMPCNNLVLEIPPATSAVAIQDDWWGGSHDVTIPGAAPTTEQQPAAPEVAASAAAVEQEVPAAVEAKQDVVNKASPAVEVPEVAAATPEALEAKAAAEKLVSETDAAVKEAVAASVSPSTKTPKTRKPTGASSNGNGASSNGNGKASGISRLFK